MCDFQVREKQEEQNVLSLLSLLLLLCRRMERTCELRLEVVVGGVEHKLSTRQSVQSVQ